MKVSSLKLFYFLLVCDVFLLNNARSTLSAETSFSSSFVNNEFSTKAPPAPVPPPPPPLPSSPVTASCEIDNQKTEDNAWKRHFNYNNNNYSIRIEVTNRPSHRIISHILAILLRSKLRYEEVQFVEQKWDSPHEALNRLSCKNSCDIVPTSFINMEVWMAPGFNIEQWVNRGEVIDCGPLGPITQLGIFTHQSLIESVMKENGIALDHYRSIQNAYLRDHIFTEFHPNLSAPLNQSNIWKIDSSNCHANKCINFFVDRPELVLPLRKLMRTVFPNAPYRMYLGNQSSLMHWLHPPTKKDPLFRLKRSAMFGASDTPLGVGSPPLASSASPPQPLAIMDYFVNWYPNVLTVAGNYTHILLPDAYTSADEDSHICPAEVEKKEKAEEEEESSANVGNFTVYQPTKVMWSKLHSEPALELVSKMKFSQADYKYLLSRVKIKDNMQDMDKEYHTIACQWLKDNHQKWEPWIRGYNDKKLLLIGGMFSVGMGKLSASSLIPAAEAAIRDMNRDFFAKSQYRVQLVVKNLTSEQDRALETYIDLSGSCSSDRALIGIVAALRSSTLEPMIKLANRQHRLVISSTVESAKYLLDGYYEYFFRTAPSRRYYSQLLLNIFQFHKWKRVVLFRQDDNFIDSRIFKDDVTLLHDFKNSEDSMSYDKAFSLLKQTKERFARIFLVEYSREVTSMIICAAYKLNMTFTNKHVWFLNADIPIVWDRVEPFWPANCTREEIKNGYFGYFKLMHHIKDSSRSSKMNNQNGSSKTMHMPPPPSLSLGGNHQSPPQVGAGGGSSSSLVVAPAASRQMDQSVSDKYEYYKYTYDAVYVLGAGIHSLLEQNPSAVSALSSAEVAEAYRVKVSQTNTRKALAHGTSTSTLLSFDKNNELASALWTLYQYRDVAISLFVWSQEKSMLQGNESELEIVNVPLGQNGSSVWHRVKRQSCQCPEDGSKEEQDSQNMKQCLFSFFALWLNTSCSKATAVFFATPSFILAVLLALFVIYCKHKLNNTSLRYKKPFDELRKDLHSICIHASQIKLNQRLGKGAFGEVHCADYKNGARMENVAVKIISVTTSYEAQIDFLNEAKLMTQLQHPSIVKIFAMCFDVPRIYLVMELMKWGDLKTFLLGRRTTCKECDPETSEVSPRYLTKYMIEVAQALGYMHSKNLVHRDVASRNCLVTEEDNLFLVKIGDFGLARRLQGSDDDRYYQFKKKAEVPIRWMSPQDLNFGRSNIYSDIWSYGVLLYEVITFGAFPYEDMLEDAISDEVKRGTKSIVNCLPSEVATNPELYDLIVRCSKYTPEERPKSMSEIVEILCANNCMIRPYLFENPPKMTFTRMTENRNKLSRAGGDGDRIPHVTLLHEDLPSNGHASHKSKSNRLLSISSLTQKRSHNSRQRQEDRRERTRMSLASTTSTTPRNFVQLSRSNSKALSTEYLSQDQYSGHNEISAVSAPEAAHDLVFECNGGVGGDSLHAHIVQPSLHHHNKAPMTSQATVTSSSRGAVAAPPPHKSTSLFSVSWASLGNKLRGKRFRNNHEKPPLVDQRAGSEGERVDLLGPHHAAGGRGRTCSSVHSLHYNSAAAVANGYITPTPSVDSIIPTVGGDVGAASAAAAAEVLNRLLRLDNNNVVQLHLPV